MPYYFYLILFVIVYILVLAIVFFYKLSNYNSSYYKKISGNSYFKVLFNSGIKGEYKVFRALNKLKVPKRLLTNVYIPRKNGEYTEADIVMITSGGIYVFEVKNYKGLILGSKTAKEFTQVLGKIKHKFFNPILQNQVHMNAMKNYLEFENDIYFKSIIVFCGGCNINPLKTIPDVNITDLKGLKKLFLKLNTPHEGILSVLRMNEIYNNLLPLTNRSTEVKAQHIKTIQKNHRN